jgi:hypothetical protein
MDRMVTLLYRVKSYLKDNSLAYWLIRPQALGLQDLQRANMFSKVITQARSKGTHARNAF